MSEHISDPSILIDRLRGDGQPWLLVRQAVEIAASPDMVREFVGYTVFGETPPRPLPDRPPTNQWLAMYRGHRIMQDCLTAHMSLPEGLTASGFLDVLREGARMSREEVAEELSEWTPEEIQEFLRPFIGVPFPPDDATLRAMLNDLEAQTTPDGPDEESMLDELMASPAGQFFARVWWPCWILYRDYPPRLLRAARLGDLDALDRLLRLDKHAVGDPGVSRVVADIMSSAPMSDRKRITSALSGRPKVKFTDSNIRAGLAALISQLAFLFHTSVTAPEIQALFDALERVRTGAPSDPKITAAGETWSKAVQRGRTWPSLPTKLPGQ